MDSEIEARGEPKLNKLDPDVKRVLRLAQDELTQLRRRVAELEPKAHAYDTIAQVARLSMPLRSEACGVDIAWRITSLVEADDALPTGETKVE